MSGYSNLTFTGWRRENGRVGVRNHVVILPVDDISNAACEAVANNIKGTMALPHAYGRLQFGADLDLHFLHPNGNWNTLPFDVFWSNPEAEWGAPGPSDNPSLDIDDTDGAGPENINMRDPESGVTYAVGVYYYDDTGFGPSYATVRMYIRGTQRFEWRDMYLPKGQSFWYVATIAWPSTDIFAVNQVQDGFPTRP